MNGRGTGRSLGALTVPKALQSGACAWRYGTGCGVNLEGVARHHGGVGHGKGALRGVRARPRGRVQAVVQKTRPHVVLPVMGHGAIRGLGLLRPLRLGLGQHNGSVVGMKVEEDRCANQVLGEGPEQRNRPDSDKKHASLC